MALRLASRVLQVSSQIPNVVKMQNIASNSRICCLSSIKKMSTSDTPSSSTEALSPNDVVNPNFINRNPRNLEKMAIAKKRKGWAYQAPYKEFYHKVIFQVTKNHTSALLLHTDGDIVVSASTKEIAISRHLYSKQDVSAAENIGRVMAKRCLESGITCMTVDIPETGEYSEKFQAFTSAMEEGGVTLEEPEEVIPPYEPGIDYDNEEEYQNLSQRQQRVNKLGEFHQMSLKTRRRRIMDKK